MTGDPVADDIPFLVQQLERCEAGVEEAHRPLTLSAWSLGQITGFTPSRARRVAQAGVEAGQLVKVVLGERTVRYRLNGAREEAKK